MRVPPGGFGGRDAAASKALAVVGARDEDADDPTGGAATQRAPAADLAVPSDTESC